MKIKSAFNQPRSSQKARSTPRRRQRVDNPLPHDQQRPRTLLSRPHRCDPHRC